VAGRARLSAGHEGQVALHEVDGVVGLLGVGSAQTGGARVGEAREVGGADALAHGRLHGLEQERRRDALAAGGGLEARVREDEALLGRARGVQEEEALLLHRVAGGPQRRVEGLALVVEEEGVGARRRGAARGGDGGDEDTAVGERALAVDLGGEEIAHASQEVLAG
jgi:hypothetical protein